MLDEQRVEARPATGGGVAADACIDHAVRIMLGGEALLQQRGPARIRGESVAGGYAVAQHQHHWRRDGASARRKRGEQREKQSNQRTARHSDSHR